MRIMTQRLFITGITLSPALAIAQELEEATGGKQPSLFWIIIQSVLALALVIGGIYLVVWVLKQAMNRTSGGGGLTNREMFGVVHRSAVSPKHSIYAVRFLDDLFILAGNEENITVVHRYAQFDQWEKFESGGNSAGGSFADVLKDKFSDISGGSGLTRGARKP